MSAGLPYTIRVKHAKEEGYLKSIDKGYGLIYLQGVGVRLCVGEPL